MKIVIKKYDGVILIPNNSNYKPRKDERVIEIDKISKNSYIHVWVDVFENTHVDKVNNINSEDYFVPTDKDIEVL